MSFQHALTNLDSDQKKNPVLFILFGASNLARSFYGLKLSIKRCIHPRPATFIHAMGPGRGYLGRGGILNTTYPPIIDCGILESIQKIRKPNQQIIALITDIGNDIMYGIHSKKIIEGLQSVLDTLSKVTKNIFITPIPINLKNDVGEFYFRVLRCIFFPKSFIKYSQTLESIEIINQFILHSSNKKTTIINGMEQFSGLDKIHYSFFKNHLAWAHIANRLIEPIGINVSPILKFPEALLSLTNNLARILLIDILRIINKNNETF
jgi:hypothetical protein